MALFIIRHAPAEPTSESSDDAARPLTEEGRQRWRRAVKGLGKLGVQFDALYHSPWLRAVQTADALCDLVQGNTQVTEHLAQAPTPALLELLQGERIALVGHEPWLGQLVAWLAIGNPEHGTAFELKKGSVVWLEGAIEPGKMLVHAVLPPKVLRAAA
jgi:phosphohistidine phosphatase